MEGFVSIAKRHVSPPRSERSYGAVSILLSGYGQWNIKTLREGVMRKFRLFTLAIAMFLIAACGGPEVEENPAPVTWDGATFQPQTINHYPNRQVWNNVKAAIGGATGYIKSVSIENDAIIVKNATFKAADNATVKASNGGKITVDTGQDFYAEELKFIGVEGDYKGALKTWAEAFASPALYAEQLAGSQLLEWLPEFYIREIEGKNIVSTSHGFTTEVGMTNSRDLTALSCGPARTTGIRITNADNDAVISSISSISLNGYSIPVDVMISPDMLIVDKLDIRKFQYGMPSGRYHFECEDIQFSMKDGRFFASVNGLNIPGKNLEILGVHNFGKNISINGSTNGSFNGDVLTDDTVLDVKDMFTVNMGLRMSPKAGVEYLNMDLKDKGMVDSLDRGIAGSLIALGGILPSGTQTLFDFFSRPGRTLNIKLDDVGNSSRFYISIND